MPIDHAYGLPTLFAVFNSVVRSQSKRVCESAGSGFEAHFVFFEMTCGVLIIPFESNVHTFMLVHFCWKWKIIPEFAGAMHLFELPVAA
jgi:hypothetical protein